MQLMDANFSCFNDNLSGLTEEVWSLEPIVHTDTATRYIITTVCFILIILGIPWNCVIIGIIMKKKLYKDKPTIILLLNLCIVDLLLCILVMPFNLVPGITGEFNFGSTDAARCSVCQVGVVYIMLVLVLLFNFSLLSADRLIYIRWAIRYHLIIKTWRLILIVLLAWLISVIAALPPVFGFGEMQFSTAIGICTIKFSGSTPISQNVYYLVVLLVTVLAPIIVLIVTNSWVVYIAQKHLRVVYRNTKEKKEITEKSIYQDLKKRHTTVQINFIKIYTAIFVTFIITWFPILIRLLLGIVAEDAEFTPSVRVIGALAYLALLSQVIIHPTLLALLIREVKETLSTCAIIPKKRHQTLNDRCTRNSITLDQTGTHDRNRDRLIKCCDALCMKSHDNGSSNEISQTSMTII